MQKSNPPAGRPKLVVIVGPTASGKTALSLKLAKKFNGEIISADSRAIYKGLDIGSAKPPRDVTSYKLQVIGKELKRKTFNLKTKTSYFVNGVPHHLIDIVSPNETLTLSQYKKLALAKLSDIGCQKAVPFLVGGTALYIYSVIDNWLIPEVPPDKKLRAKLEKLSVKKLYEKLIKKDPKAEEFIDSQNKRRIIRALEVIAATDKPFSQQRQKGQPLFDVLILGVKKSPEETKKIVARRTKQMLKAGLVAEVKNLLKKGYSPKSPALSGIHYKEIIDYVNKKTSLSEAIALINKNDEQLVHRQMTWFKKDKRIQWINKQTEAEKLVSLFIK
ncbi:MAG: tRNA (adenosine(37)-N6)-dimethylallyltransferase MiaA [Candidatus Yanofskybacteria bacterium]|nr:tRNA (adenosine(37)-N6)-dimethylallyltransferase MiaA [Candidatus Yanofskybacteria bacterium]